ncbi:MAG: MotA/TolQ/ExbB proton channel family protein [Lachnospiraceae bacterium]|nr:MotA/TolQ/ExbB proton channel family protein [Lachnospiraceae bacterium]
MGLGKTLLDNFLKFDFIIFVLGAFNAVVMFVTLNYSKKLFRVMNPECWIPGGTRTLGEIEEKFNKQSDMTSESELIALRRKTNLWFMIYENITTIFPLMGMLGTVIALIPMVGSMGDTATGLFFGALTSTFWGIVFAIIFKAVNGFLSAQIDDNEKNMEVFLARNTSRINEKRGIASEDEEDDFDDNYYPDDDDDDMPMPRSTTRNIVSNRTSGK